MRGALRGALLAMQGPGCMYRMGAGAGLDGPAVHSAGKLLGEGLIYISLANIDMPS